MKTIHCGLVLSLLSVAAHAQMPLGNYWDTWYMHDQVSLEFTSGQLPAVVLDSCPMSVGDYVYTVTDPVSGKVAFSISSDQGVQDGNGLPVPGSSSLFFDWHTHVIPHPGDATLYYLFYNDGQTSRYSLLQVNVQMGTAGFINNQTDVLLADGVGESAGIISDPDGIDHWLLLHHWSDNTIHTYNVNAGPGLITTPVVQTLAQALPSNATFKTSPSNTRVLVTTGNGNFLLYDIDPETGLLGASITLNATNSSHGEFSPNSDVLYLTRYIAPDSALWLQYDLSSGDQATITNSVIRLDPNGVPSQGTYPTMQLGPDGRIYCTLAGGPVNDPYYFETHLVLIHSPNTIGAGCQLDTVGIDLVRLGMTPYYPPKVHWFGTPLSAVEAEMGRANPYVRSIHVSALPNPAAEWLDISVEQAVPTGTRMEMVSGAGSVVWNEKWPGGFQSKVPLPPLASGLYTLRLVAPDGAIGKTRITIVR